MTYFQRIGLLNAYQPEERTLLSLTRRDSDMDYTHCVFQSRVRGSRRSASSAGLSGESSATDLAKRSRTRQSSTNNNGQLEAHFYPDRDPAATVKNQLAIASHNIKRCLTSPQLTTAHHHLVAHRAHAFPPFL